MLSQRYPLNMLRDVLIPRDGWKPFPLASERGPWENVAASVKRAHIARGESALGYVWPPPIATLFLEYSRNGNRSNYQGQVRDARRRTLCELVIAECLEGGGRFVDDIVNGIWATCEESFWGVPAHVGPQKAGVGLPDVAEPVVDLFAAEASALLAWTRYLLAPQLDAVSPLICKRIDLEIDRRILTPNLERNFGWMGFRRAGRRGGRVNNWNPWINSNWLTSTLLVEQDPERRLASVARAMESVDNFIDPYPVDGGCDEGPGYWGHAGGSMFDCLELLRSATGGAVDVYDDRLIQNIGRFIYRAHIADSYFVNFADASAVNSPSAATVYRFGRCIQDTHMASLGAWAARDQRIAEKGLTDSIGRQLPALLALDEILSAEVAQPLVRDVWLPEIQVMVARDVEGCTEGFFVAAKGGHNAESHNHNDVGSFIVYVDGKPLLVDAGVEAYTRKTFSPERYSIWTMQSAYHSLPTVNGTMQTPGRQFAAKDAMYSAADEMAELSLDISDAYPNDAGIASWARTVRLNRRGGVALTDTYELEGVTGDLFLSLLTPCDVSHESPGTIDLARRTFGEGRESASGRVIYDADAMAPETDDIPVTDDRLGGVWGDHLVRIVLRVPNPKPKGSWTIRIER